MPPYFALVVNCLVICGFGGATADGHDIQNDEDKQNSSRQGKPLSAAVDILR